MRTKRTIRLTDTKRILTKCIERGMTNEGISIRLGCSVRSIQKWWDDTCPSPQMYHRLWMLEESFKRQDEQAIRLKKWEQEQQKKREHEQRRALLWKHHEEVPHPNGECDECLRILGIKTDEQV